MHTNEAYRREVNAGSDWNSIFMQSRSDGGAWEPWDSWQSRLGVACRDWAESMTAPYVHVIEAKLPCLARRTCDTERAAVRTEIENAFADAHYPGDSNLIDDFCDEERMLLRRDFVGKSDWRVLDPKFLDQAPDGYGSALSFFSDEAFRFYLPAYMLADLKGKRDCQDPAFHLWHSVYDDEKDEVINAAWYGPKTWFDYVLVQPELGASPVRLRY